MDDFSIYNDLGIRPPKRRKGKKYKSKSQWMTARERKAIDNAIITVFKFLFKAIIALFKFLFKRIKLLFKSKSDEDESKNEIRDKIEEFNPLRKIRDEYSYEIRKFFFSSI